MPTPLRTIAFLLFAACATGCRQPAPDQQLMTAPVAFPDHPHYNVAFLIMDGVYNTELTAPYDIFQHTRYREGIRPMIPFTVAGQSDPVRTFEGLSIQPDYNYLTDSIPPIDILVVPSAEHHLDTDLENIPMIEFVRQAATEASWVTSHCDGAFVLAAAGLLDTVESTTFPADIATFRQRFPKLVVHDSVWFVHDGKYITSAGGARSFEAALYLCDILYGPEIAHRLGQGLVLDWDLSSVPHRVVPGSDTGDPRDTSRLAH